MRFAAFAFVALAATGMAIFTASAADHSAVTATKAPDERPFPGQHAPLGEMSQDQIRKELIGPPMKGNYADGLPWDETYFHDSSIVYSDALNNWQGIWSFRGAGFCTFYNEGQNGGCWTILKTSANCYEFYPAAFAGKLIPRKPLQKRNWTARGWRTTAASTCDVGVGV